jgi:hypothetical protein
MAKRKVVITGACGFIMTRVLPALRERYDLTLLDKRNTNPDGEKVEGVILTDLLNRDRDSYREHFRGVDAVIHSGFVRAKEGEERYWVEAGNVDMAYNVYQTCIEEGVRRLVVISSNHAADYYEHLIWTNRMLCVTPDMKPLSDNFYGWAKIAYEALGFVFATGNVTRGKRLQNVQIRIGAPRETDLDKFGPDDLKQVHRALGAYESLRDEVQLIVKSIETESIEDENGVPFQIFYGISGNTHAFWDIANARMIIGFEPQDDSALHFADRVTRIISEAAKRYG